jgi:FlgD Ig-like domain
VRTLVPFVTRPGGTYTDTWDGKDDSGAVVPEGEYGAILLYETADGVQRLDLGLTTGGAQYNPPRTSIPSSFSPFAGLPLTIDFTLTRASEVTAFIGRFNVDTRLVTFLQRQPFGRGTYRIVWNGENGDGQMMQPPPGDAFLFGIFGYTFPDNAVFVHSGVQLSAVAAAPSIFDPTELDASGQPRRSTISFTISKPASIEMVVQDVTSGTILGRLNYPAFAAGANTIAWDGKLPSGLLAAPGRYRLGLTAIEANGFKSLTLYALQRIYF